MYFISELLFINLPIKAAYRRRKKVVNAERKKEGEKEREKKKEREREREGDRERMRKKEREAQFWTQSSRQRKA